MYQPCSPPDVFGNRAGLVHDRPLRFRAWLDACGSLEGALDVDLGEVRAVLSGGEVVARVVEVADLLGGGVDRGGVDVAGERLLDAGQPGGFVGRAGDGDL